MANTYTQIDLHVVFAVKARQCLVKRAWKDYLYRYITGIVQNQGHKMLQVNGMPDHIHLFIGYNHNQLISDLVRTIKISSDEYVKQKRFTPHKFNWQKGYGAFAHSRSNRDRVIKYVANQEEHHRTKSFREEYLECLQEFQVEYEEKYLFDFTEISGWD